MFNLVTDSSSEDEIENAYAVYNRPLNTKFNRWTKKIKSNKNLSGYLDEMVEDVSKIDEKTTAYTAMAWMTDVNCLYALKMTNNDCTTLPIYTIKHGPDDEFSWGVIIEIYETEWTRGIKGKQYRTLLDTKYAPNMIKIIHEGIQRCKKKGKIIVLRMRFNFFARLTKGEDFKKEATGHSNLLVINYMNNTVERYEPQISDSENIIKINTEIDTTIKEDIVDNLNNHYGYDFKFVSSVQTCPASSSIQTLETSVDFDWNKVGGFCSAFSALYARLRLSYPLLSQQEINDTLVEKFDKDPKQIKIFMIRYISYITELIDKAGVDYIDIVDSGEINFSNYRDFKKRLTILQIRAYVRSFVWSEYSKVLDMNIKTVKKLANSSKSQLKYLKKVIDVSPNITIRTETRKLKEIEKKK